MSALRLLVTLFLLAVVPALADEARTVSALLAEIRVGLPTGWVVTYGEEIPHLLEVTRKEQTLVAAPVAINASGGPEEPPKNETISFVWAGVPMLTGRERVVSKIKRLENRELLARLARELERRRVPPGVGRYRPQNDADRELVAEYEAAIEAERALRLPEYYYHDLGLDERRLFPSIVDPGIRAEAEKVHKEIIALLKPYDPLPPPAVKP